MATNNNMFALPIVSKEMVRLMESELVLGKLVGNDKLDTEKVKHGGTIKVYRQSAYQGQNNNLNLAAYQEDVIEGVIDVKMDKTWSNKVALSALERTLSFDRASEQVLKPMARRAAEVIEQSIAELYTRFYLFGGTPGVIPSTFLSLANAGAVMSDAGNAIAGRIAVHSPMASANLANTIASTYVGANNKTALEKAMVGNFAGFDNYQSAFVPTHQVGVATGAPTVTAAGQSVLYATPQTKDDWTQTLNTTGWTASTVNILREGDTFTIAGVNMVNPNTKEDVGYLQTFTVIKAAGAVSIDSTAGGAAALTISPPIIIAGAYKTVTAAPAAAAAITVKSGASLQKYRQSLLIDPSAIALATRPLDIPSGQGVETHTTSGEFVTLSVTKWVDGNTIEQNLRFDMLWKPVVLDPRRGMRLTN